jgi:VIT1/CCC1 family predicted Fe2+/Mn2+ transporter
MDVMDKIMAIINFVKGIWDWLSGKKTTVGAIITIIAYLAGVIPLLAPFVPADKLVEAVGISTMIIGLLHRLYKYIYGEEHS